MTSVCDVCDNERLLDGTGCVIPGVGGVGRWRPSEQAPLQEEGKGGQQRHHPGSHLAAT